jgi:Ca2+-binding EF-hand superfamily protein
MQDNIQDIFNVFDVNKNGTIKEADFKKILLHVGDSPLTPQCYSYLISKVPIDHNGFIQINDVLKVLS